jgi:hypothetical protein
MDMVGEALKIIGVDLSTVTPSQKKFLIESTQHLLQEHGLQWIKENHLRLFCPLFRAVKCLVNMLPTRTWK